MSLNTECDICGKKYTLPSNAAGDILECKECGAEFEIPLIPWWRSLFDEHADSTATFRSIVTAGCAALVLFLMAIAGYELTRESVTHRNEQLAQTAAPVSPATERRNHEAVPAQPSVIQNNPTNSTPQPPSFQATVVEPTEHSPKPPNTPSQTPAAPPKNRQPTEPPDGRKPDAILAAQFAKSATLATQITEAVPDAQRRIARIKGKGLDRAKQLLLIPVGGKPISAIINSRSDTELVVSDPNGRVLAVNALPGVETPEGLIIGYPTYARELQAPPRSTLGVFYIPESQQVPVFNGIYHLLLLPQATLAAGPNGRRGDIATIIVLRGAHLVDRPSFSIGCWVSETGAVNSIEQPELSQGIQATLEFPNIYLCPIPATINDNYRNIVR